MNPLFIADFFKGPEIRKSGNYAFYYLILARDML